MNRSIIYRNIKKKWDKPEKLVDFILDLEKQQEIDLELAYKKGMKETAKNYSIAVAYTLNYKFGFGRKRLEKLLNDVAFICDSFATGHLTIEDCQEELKKVGVHIV